MQSKRAKQKNFNPLIEKRNWRRLKSKSFLFRFRRQAVGGLGGLTPPTAESDVLIRILLKVSSDFFQKSEQLKNPEFKRYYDEYGKQLEIAYQILQLRKKKKMTQAELAKKIGTKQSNIARMETGQQNFTIEILQKIASVLGKNLKVEFTK